MLNPSAIWRVLGASLSLLPAALAGCSADTDGGALAGAAAQALSTAAASPQPLAAVPLAAAQPKNACVARGGRAHVDEDAGVLAVSDDGAWAAMRDGRLRSWAADYELELQISDISADATVVLDNGNRNFVARVGTLKHTGTEREPAISPLFRDLPNLGQGTGATGMSPDGKHIVGHVLVPRVSSTPVYWEEKPNGQWSVGKLSLPGGTRYAGPVDVSDNGALIAGVAELVTEPGALPNRRHVLWRRGSWLKEGAGTDAKASAAYGVQLVQPDRGCRSPRATHFASVSANGRVAAFTCLWMAETSPVTEPPNMQAFLWKDGRTHMILPPSGYRDILIRALSADGSVAVGVAYDNRRPGLETAVYWTEEGGARPLHQVLQEKGIPWSGLLTNATAISRDGVTIGGDVDGGARGFLVRIPPCRDFDRDGLCDSWERMGGVDLDGDGAIIEGHDVVLEGANPMHKDIYVEVDTLAGVPAPDTALSAVQAAFADVPNELIRNPDGEPGIALHIQIDERTVQHPNRGVWDLAVACGEELGIAHDRVYRAHFGTVRERQNLDVLEAKRGVFRWGIIGGVDVRTPSITGKSSLWGNTLRIHPRASDGDLGVSVTFMHELGHLLGLGHGGPLRTLGDYARYDNYKPNYYSLMNYSWSSPPRNSTDFSLAAQQYRASFRLDFSRRALNELDERSLDERAGIGGDPRVWTPVGPPPHRYESQGLPLDFNRNGRIDDGRVGSEDEPIDVNWIFESRPGDPDSPVYPPTPGDVLDPASDWDVIADSVLCDAVDSGNWLSEPCPVDPGPLPAPDPRRVPDEPPMPEPPTFIDCNQNGELDDLELEGGLYGDIDGNGVLDVCEPKRGDLDLDGDVDDNDQRLLRLALPSRDGERRYRALADMDRDRDVDDTDLLRWFEAFCVVAACDDGNSCTSDRCDPEQGGCVAVPACDDGNACTRDLCSATQTCEYERIGCGDNPACGCGCSNMRLTTDATGPTRPGAYLELQARAFCDYQVPEFRFTVRDAQGQPVYERPYESGEYAYLAYWDTARAAAGDYVAEVEARPQGGGSPGVASASITILPPITGTPTCDPPSLLVNPPSPVAADSSPLLMTYLACMPPVLTESRFSLRSADGSEQHLSEWSRNWNVSILAASYTPGLYELIVRHRLLDGPLIDGATRSMPFEILP